MLETRLAHLAKMVDSGSRIADIGTDHAYLPIALVQAGKVDFAIASDVAKGPLDNAKNDIQQAGLEQKIIPRLGSGLETLNPDDQIDTVIIAGMGGKLMVDLLTTAKNQGKVYPTLILEPNVGEHLVRTWLMQNSYRIVQEEIIDTSGHIYELIKAVKSEQPVSLTQEEITFGPLLLAQHNEVFQKKWQKQLAYNQQLLTNLQKAQKPDQTKIKAIKELIKMIEVVIND